MRRSAHLRTSVAPWEEYVDAMQPTFDITEEDALQQVIPTTRRLEESIIDSVQAAFALSMKEKGIGGEGEEDEGVGAEVPNIQQNQSAVQNVIRENQAAGE